MEEVKYNGEMYFVIYKYDSGYWEIRKKDASYINVLIHHSEIEGEKVIKYKKDHCNSVNDPLHIRKSLPTCM